jgi:hypothetical protein
VGLFCLSGSGYLIPELKVLLLSFVKEIGENKGIKNTVHLTNFNNYLPDHQLFIHAISTNDHKKYKISEQLFIKDSTFNPARLQFCLLYGGPDPASAVSLDL